MGLRNFNFTGTCTPKCNLMTKFPFQLLKKHTSSKKHLESSSHSDLKKYLRTNQRYLQIKAGRYIAVFDRDFCRDAEPLEFIEKIDALMDKGQILKSGDTSYVSRLTWNDKDVVVKRYNHRGFIYSLRHTIKRSRARRGWLHGHRLEVLGIATPKPLAYIEQYKGKLIWQSYLVTEYVKGQNFYYFLRDDKISEKKRSNVSQQVAELLNSLSNHKITHGDLRHSNILITESGPVLTDLDAMKVHRWDWMFKIKRDKDITRLTKDEQTNRCKDEDKS